MALTEQPADTTSTLDSTESSLNDLAEKTKQSGKPDPELAVWIMEKVSRWRTSRDNNYGTDWEKYYRIWRGKWDPSLKGKLAERSRIITPATQSAVDQTVAEMTEAVFGRGMWFDLSEPAPPPAPPPPPGQPPPQGPSPEDAARARDESIRDNLIDDFQNSRLTADVIETFYNGAITGTGISKRVKDTRLDGTKFISWAPVHPSGFVIDTAATTIDDALGMAHETIRPLHEIQAKQESGEYYDEDIGTSASGFGASDLMKGGLTDFLEIDPQDGVYITEWHGKIPAKYLGGKPDEEKDDIDLYADEETEGDESDEEELVEAIVVIGNATHVLSAEKNTLNDRGFIAYQHHRSPDSFFGIGVVEKAYNSQVGLDGEVRARQDALSLTTYPTVGVDATRMPRNLNMVVGPGKVYLTNGRPSEVIEPIIFGNLNNASFQQSGDMERYVQVATGATDPAKPVNGNTTASGQSQQSSAFIKRAKLTMQSVDVYLASMIRKSIIAYNALDPQRYPKLPNFTVNSTMSIMAREFEQMQMTNLLAVVPQESPAFPIILKGIIESYSGPSKDKIIAAIEETMKPDPAKQQAAAALQQAQLQEQQGKVAKLQAEVKEIESRGMLNGSKSKQLDVKTQLAPAEVHIQALQAGASHKQAHNGARANEIQAAGMQIDHHHKSMGHVHEKVKNAIALQKEMQPPAAGQGA